jgi:pyruvate kinase
MSQGMTVDVKVGQEIDIDNGRVRIIVEQKDGKRARLRVIADKGIIISRPLQKDCGASHIRTK